MTEPNSDARQEAVRRIAWPDLPLETAEAPDRAVRAILETVRQIPELPVSDHPAAYAGMHDSLLAALNEDTSAGTGA
ncbi:MAG: hypothetical protein K0Q84_2330 [Arthrobacter sp.]|jgi:hypothetical protein|nr:hypothetical protein [Arthrobacter sp.]MCE3293393.1 hypothetical protein [Arthrobacter sp.]